MCGQGLSGSPLVHSILRSPLCFPSVKNVPAIKSSSFLCFLEGLICSWDDGSGRVIELWDLPRVNGTM